MGFRFYRRINLGKGLGLNISKSGVSPSIRTKAGSTGSKRYSIRTGIPGLSYRGSYNSKGGCLVTFVFIVVGITVLCFAWF